MQYTNIEIKARCFHPEMVEAFLFSHNARFAGTDHQKDVYFNVSKGRLKLRQGDIENNLIYYNRSDQKAPKQSEFSLSAVINPSSLQTVLSKALGIKVIVEKKRKIFFLDDIKIHLDEISALGSFIEIEAGNMSNPDIPVNTLHEQCRQLMYDFNIKDDDLIENSYSDMLLVKSEERNPFRLL
jgi:adenylate cyclase class 2